MNSVERIRSTIAGTPVDRRATSPVLGLYGARLTKCATKLYYVDPVAYARGQDAVLELFQPDILFAPLTFAAIGAAFGSELHYPVSDVPRMRRPAIQSADQLDSLEWPDPDVHPQLLFLRDTIHRLFSAHGSTVPIAVVIPIPVDIPHVIMGLEAWLDTVLFHADTARRFMARLLPFYVRLVNSFFDDGAAFAAMPSGLASPSVVTRAIVGSFTRPVLEQCFNLLHGPVVIHNVGAPLLPHLDLLTGLPSVMGFVLDQRDDRSQARNTVGPEPVLLGGLDCANLSQMSAAEAEAVCRAILRERRDDPRFVLGTSGPDIPLDTPPETIHAIRRAAEAEARE